MKLLVDGPVFKAVNGLWRSGLYATLTGSVAGIACGAVAGFVLMIGIALTNSQFFNAGALLLMLFGALCGGFYGFFIGAAIGLPSGILASGLGERQGCRTGTAIAAFSLGSAIAYFPLRESIGRTSDGEERWYSLLIPLAVLLFTVVSYWVGNHLYTRLENSNGLFTHWRRALHESGLEGLDLKDRRIALAIAITPVVFVYGYILVSLLLGHLLF